MGTTPGERFLELKAAALAVTRAGQAEVKARGRRKVEEGREKSVRLSEGSIALATKTAETQGRILQDQAEMEDIRANISAARQDEELRKHPTAQEQVIQSLQEDLAGRHRNIAVLQEEEKATPRKRLEIDREMKAAHSEVRAILQGREISAEQIGEIWGYVQGQRALRRKAAAYENVGKDLVAVVMAEAEGKGKTEVVIDEDSTLKAKEDELKAMTEALQEKAGVLKQKKDAKDAAERLKQNAQQRCGVEYEKFRPVETQERQKRGEVESQNKKLESLNGELGKLNATLHSRQEELDTNNAAFVHWIKEDYEPTVGTLRLLEKQQEEHLAKLDAEKIRLVQLTKQKTEAEVKYQGLNKQTIEARGVVNQAEQRHTNLSKSIPAKKKEHDDIPEGSFFTDRKKRAFDDLTRQTEEFEKLSLELPGLRANLLELETQNERAFAQKESADREFGNQKTIADQLQYAGPSKEIAAIRKKLDTGGATHSDGLDPQKNSRTARIMALERGVQEIRLAIGTKQTEIAAQQEKTRRLQQDFESWQKDKVEPSRKDWDTALAEFKPLEQAYDARVTEWRAANSEHETESSDLGLLGRTVRSSRQAYEGMRDSLENSQVYNGLVQGFAAVYAKAEKSGPTNVVMRIGGKDLPLWANGQPAELKPLPGPPEFVTKLGESSAAIIQAEIDKESPGPAGLSGALEKAEVIPGLYEDIAEEAEADHAEYRRGEIKAKQAEIVAVSGLRKSLLGSAEQHEKDAANLASLLPQARAWDEARAEFENALVHLTISEAQLAEERGKRRFALTPKDVKERIENLESHIVPEAQERFSKAATQATNLEGQVLAIRPGAIESYTESVEGVGRVSKKRLVKSIAELTQDQRQASRLAQEEKSKAVVLERVEKAWQDGRMLDYSQAEAEFALAEVRQVTVGDIDGNPIQREENILDFLAQDAADNFGYSKIEGGKPLSARVRIGEWGVSLFNSASGDRQLGANGNANHWRALVKLKSEVLRKALEEKLFRRLKIRSPEPTPFSLELAEIS